MKISTKGRYGLRLMVELALYHGQELLTAKELAERQDISDKYVEQIIGILNKAGLLISQRGASGGYRLADHPDNITVGAVICATEGGIHVVDCVSSGGMDCEKEYNCVTNSVWREVKDSIEQVVNNITLSDLVTRYKENQDHQDFVC